jgi:ppGpp synthetase/RelA/SpoT-type nucleotidyltranferase
MIDIAEIKERWEKERPLYERLREHVEPVIINEIKKIGVRANVNFRIKELDKLLKKALRKQCPYERISDKLGLRIILYFRKYLPLIDRLIQSTFDVKKREDRSAELGVDRWGYQGIHFDVQLFEHHYRQNKEYKGVIFEVQLQTHCQNVWCELNHELYYKSDLAMPDDYIRAVNRLSALLETADIEFERTYDMISELPAYREVKLLEMLEKHYYELIARPYDRELSLDVLARLCESFERLSAEEYRGKIDAFVKSDRTMLEQVISDYTLTPDRSLFLFQPEGLLLLLLIDEDPFLLKSVWAKSYPINELETLANICGKNIS